MATINGIQYIRADANDNSEIVVRVKQYDKATRFLNITYAESGNVYRIDNSLYRAVAKVKTPSYHNADYLVTIESDGTITVPLSDNILNTAGVGSMEIDLYSKISESVISTMPIKLIVVGSVYDDTDEVGGDEYSVLKDLIAEAIRKEAEYETAENARADAENKRVDAENKRNAEETTRGNNEKTRGNNETARETNEKKRKESEQNRVNVEKLRVSAEESRVEEFKELKKASETATAGAEKVNIKSNSATDSYTLTITNRNGDSSISPNLLNKIGIGAVNTLASDKTATASLTGNFGSQKLNLGIPVGKTPQFTIGTVESGLTPSATITGTYENPILNLVLQKGFGNEDYLTVNDFEAMFTPTAMSTQNSENDDAENTAENTINGDKNLESV